VDRDLWRQLDINTLKQSNILSRRKSRKLTILSSRPMEPLLLLQLRQDKSVENRRRGDHNRARSLSVAEASASATLQLPQLIAASSYDILRSIGRRHLRRRRILYDSSGPVRSLRAHYRAVPVDRHALTGQQATSL